MKKRIGITGGVGSGKSVVMNYLEEAYNAKIILADLVAHDLMAPGAKSYRQIIDCFGSEILNEAKEIDRQKLGQIVFVDHAKLQQLNAITHPNVKEEILLRMDQAETDEKVDIIFLEAALLLEAGYREFLDEIWFIYVDRQVRIQRLMDGRGYTEEKSISIMEKQKSDEEFRQSCERIVDNSASVEETRKRIDQIMRYLL